MSKKTNTLFFILGATAFNILTTIICFLILMVIYARFLIDKLPEESAAWGFPIIFIAAIALSFVVYRVVLKQLMKRIDIEKHFDPIFGSRYRKPKKTD
jgi:peptidoglycan/LPS O-acetylase OafA/YrhL